MGWLRAWLAGVCVALLPALGLAQDQFACQVPLSGLTHDALTHARRLATPPSDVRLELTALDARSQRYETQARWPDVIALSETALQVARAAPLGLVQDLLVQIEWRLGRAQWQQQRGDLALAAYTRAVEHAQAVRQDLPIETADGRSVYQSLLQPLLEGYVELELNSLPRLDALRQAAALGRVRAAIEAMRQAEMQDFLGDRCTVEESATRLDAGVVVLYPLLLPERTELLVETRHGLKRYTTPVKRAEVNAMAKQLAADIRGGDPSYEQSARRLYDWLLQPLAQELKDAHTLVVVPDGALRLIPFAALRDNTSFLVERLAVAVVTGMSMTSSGDVAGGAMASLLAGVALPGPVVDKLAATDIMRPATGATRGLTLGGTLAKGRSLRSVSSVSSVSPTPVSPTSGVTQRAALQAQLALPGVRDEVGAIATTLGSRVLLDEAFTLDGFRQETERGQYRIVHIASHGVFGGTADSSFILAYDELLGINRLQEVLRSERVQQHPIELLTLSACETAEGNERAPLGIAGAAIRARAKSVLGTLWPVEDTAAKTLMGRFYRGLAEGHLSKAEALRQAQLELIGQLDYQHPFYWAPFNLVGNWK